MADEINVDLEQLGKLAKSASYDFANLAHVVKGFGDQNSAVRRFNVDLKEARKLLKDAGGSVDLVKAALKGAGVAGRDVNLVVKQLNRDMDDSRRAAMGFSGHWKRAVYDAFGPHAARAALSFFDKVRSAGGVIAGGAMGVISKALSAGENLFHKVIELGGEAEASQKGLSYILSSGAEKGTKEFDKGEAISKQMMSSFLDLAKKTPIADRDIVAAGKDFATALTGSGRSMEQVRDMSIHLVKNMADQQSKFLEDDAVRHNFVSAVTRGLGKTTASLQDLNSLRVAKYNIGAILQELPRQEGMKEIMARVKGGKFKVSEEDLASAREGVGDGEISSKELQNMAKMQKLISMAKQAGTPISYTTLFNAAQASAYKGKDVGEAAGGLAKMKASETLIGAMNNAANSLDNLLLGMGFAGSAGGKALRDFLNQLNDVIGHSAVLKNTISGLTDAVFEPLSKLTRQDIEGIIRTVGKLGEEVIGVIKQAWVWFEQLIHAKPGEFMKNVGQTLEEVGVYLGRGILRGVSGAASAAVSSALRRDDFADAAGHEKKIREGLSNANQSFGPAAWLRGARGMWNSQGSDNNPALAGLTAAQSGTSMMPPAPEGEGSEPPRWVKNIPHAADGATVAGPTLLVAGEAGTEDIVPRGRRGSGYGGGPTLIVQGPLFVVQGDVKDPDALGSAVRPLVQEEFINTWRRLAMERS